jgi:TatA/E family protein of Tat protein translocase
MFGIGMPELLLILTLALIFIGPKKLPEVAKTLERGMCEFRTATDDLKRTIEVDARVIAPDEQAPESQAKKVETHAEGSDAPGA